LNDKDIHTFLASPKLLEHLAPYMEMYRAGGKTESAKLVAAVVKGLPATLLPFKNTIVDIVIGTVRADKLGKGLRGFCYTQTAVEQSTSVGIAQYHASHFAGANCVLEICSGAGVDTQALARVAGRVVAFESDLVLSALLRGNLARNGVENVEVRSEAWTPQIDLGVEISETDAIWADPSRRSVRGRARTVHEYSPALSEIIQWVESKTSFSPRSNIRRCGIKIGPVDDFEPNENWKQEFIGYGGECKEKILWYGVEKAPRSVHIVDKGLTLKQFAIPIPIPITNTSTNASTNASTTSFENQVGNLVGVRMVEPGDFIVEPHSALIASGLLNQYYSSHGVSVMDAKIAYGLTTNPTNVLDWCAAFKVILVDKGIGEKPIRKRVAELNWNNRTEIKKRGIQIDPDVLHRSITFCNSNSAGVIILTRIGDKRYVIYATRVAGAASLT